MEDLSPALSRTPEWRLLSQSVEPKGEIARFVGTRVPGPYMGGTSTSGLMLSFLSPPVHPPPTLVEYSQHRLVFKKPPSFQMSACI